jgi:hypothetical protein
MHAFAIRHVILIVSCLAAAPAFAGVAGQSSGVTSTIGNQGTDASPEVQQQSAGFVQQNQQNAQNPVSPTGVIVPVVANAAGARGAANAASPDSNGKPGDPNGASATPATPPPPPPTYVSVVKHLTPGSDSTDPASATTAVPVAVVTPSDTQAPTVAPAQAKADTLPVPVKTATPVPPPTSVVAPTAAAEKIGASERAAETGVVSGGRGPAPDGYTFYVGFGIALLLLVVAFGAYLSSQKDEARRGS